MAMSISVLNSQPDSQTLITAPTNTSWDLVSTNQRPSDAEETSIRTIVASELQELLLLEKRIAQLQEAREGVLSRLREHLAVIHPVRRVPFEIWAIIFSMYLRDDYSVGDGSKGCWLLSHVCRHWRYVLKVFPDLWSSINIVESTVRESLGDHKGKEYFMLKRHLENSGQSMLRIRYLNDRTDQSSALLDLLAIHSHRWHHVTLKMCIFLYAKLSSIRRQLPNLYSLHLGVHSVWQPLMIDAFECCPRLTVVKFSEWRHGYSYINLPWEQITTFHDLYAKDDAEETLSLLRNASNLRELSYTVGPTRLSAQPDPVSRVDHGQLETLILRGTTLPRFVSQCSFLCLTTLSLGSLYAKSTPKVNEVFRSSLGQPWSSLHTLDIQHVGRHEGQILIDLLHVLPSLSRLEIRTWAEIELQKVVEALMLHPSSPSTCISPCLEYIKLECPLGWIGHRVVDMVESRLQSKSPPLNFFACKRIQGLQAQPVYESVIERLDRLGSLGVKVEYLPMRSFEPSYTLYN